MRIRDWSSVVCSSELTACSVTSSESGADETPTHNSHIENVITHAFHAAINFSIAAISFGAPSVSTRGPCSVITTSSSMRMPIPQNFGSRSEEHTSELQSLMRISYAVFCLKKKKTQNTNKDTYQNNTEHQYDT